MMSMIGDAERESGATEIRPGVMAGPWENGRCEHGKLYSFRWVWRKSGCVEDSTPEYGKRGCKKCRAKEEAYDE